jgi:hypothetical protein
MWEQIDVGFMEKFMNAKVQRREDSGKQSSTKGKKKLTIVFGNGVNQAQDMKVDPPQLDFLDLIPNKYSI